MNVYGPYRDHRDDSCVLCIVGFGVALAAIFVGARAVLR